MGSLRKIKSTIWDCHTNKYGGRDAHTYPTLGDIRNPGSRAPSGLAPGDVPESTTKLLGTLKVYELKKHAPRPRRSSTRCPSTLYTPMQASAASRHAAASALCAGRAASRSLSEEAVQARNDTFRMAIVGRVSGATIFGADVGEDFTSYRVHCVCDADKSEWIVLKRYSDFDKLR